MAASAATMKAFAYEEYGDSSVLKETTIPVPTPGASEVVIQSKGIGVNPVDWKLRAGYIQAWPQAFPIIPGWDVAGVVSAVGADVTDFAVGDEVYSYTRPLQPGEEGAVEGEKIGDNGTYAEYVAVASAKVAKKPTKASFEQAAGIPLAGLTAWQGLFDQGGLAAGQTVLVLNASGGVGSFAVQFAKNAGAKVIGTCSGKNAEYVTGLGADTVVDYSAGDVAAAVIAANGGAPVDLVYDAVGGDNTAVGFAALKEGGTLVTIANFEVAEVAKAAGGGKVGKVFVVAPSAAQLTTIAGQVDEGKVVIPELNTLPLSKAGEAQDLSQSHRVKGKLVLVPGASA